MEFNFNNLKSSMESQLVNKARVDDFKKRLSSLTRAEQDELMIREKTGDAEFAFLASEKTGGRKLSEEEEERLAKKRVKYKM